MQSSNKSKQIDKILANRLYNHTNIIYKNKMSIDSKLLVGVTIIHFFLQFLTHSAQKGTSLQQTPAIVIINWIWYVGIFLFLKRFKFSLAQKMKNNFFRAVVQVGACGRVVTQIKHTPLGINTISRVNKLNLLMVKDIFQNIDTKYF